MAVESIPRLRLKFFPFFLPLLVALLPFSRSAADPSLTPPGTWTRVGALGPTPTPTHPELPLSDQDNHGGWVLDPEFSDDFSAAFPNPARWHIQPTVKGDWSGRPPALFYPPNVRTGNGLAIDFKKEASPDLAKYPSQGYLDYTSGSIKTNERTGYGYYEVRAKPMAACIDSAFWLAEPNMPQDNTEIDIFEIGGRAPRRERDDNMTAHVWSTLKEGKHHWSIPGIWKAPANLADDFHVYGFEWNRDELLWYVDGVLVHRVKNTNWTFPMRILFDAEPMLKWFGPVDDASLPATYQVEYLRVWRKV
jgi:beta-glucanase (GH16 family)